MGSTKNHGDFSGAQLSLLSQDILFQILVLLGVKSLGQLKCVSKFFLSILTDPNFVEFYGNRFAALTNGTTIVFSVRFVTECHHSSYCPVSKQFYTINYEENQRGKLVHAKFVRHLDKWLKHRGFVSFAKVLMCYYNKDFDFDFRVLNIITGQHTILPIPPQTIPSRGNPCAILGFDGVLGTYKVFVLEAKRLTVKYWVFTLGVDEAWREINSSVLLCSERLFMNNVCIDGIIYSYNNLFCDSDEDGGSRLVALDVRSESFHPIPLPPLALQEILESSLLGLDGRLAVIHVHQYSQIITWSLETVAESSSCWKKHAFPLPLGADVLSIWNTSVTATPTGEIVLLTLKRTPSLWVLLDKFGAYPVWKEFRIAGLADLPPNRICESIETVEVQNIAENLFHLE